MPLARHDLGGTAVLKPEALGKPGQRTFRLVVEAEHGSATIWMEKQQMSSLALSIKASLEEVGKAKSAQPSQVRVAARQPSFEFRAAALGLTYDERTGRIGILAAAPDDAKADRMTVVCWARKDQAERMADAALEVVAAGRPICPLCHGPMDAEGHICPKANGHGTLETKS